MYPSGHAHPASLQALGVPMAAARVLAACACAEQLAATPLRDALARRVFEHLGGRLEHFDAVELGRAAFRTMVVDYLVRDYFDRAPDGLGVGVWPVLGTRAHRLTEPQWVDVDAPAVAALRRMLLPERPGWLQLGSCPANVQWLDAVCGKSNRPLLLVLDEGALPLSAGSLARFLEAASCRLPAGSELIVAHEVGMVKIPASGPPRAPVELLLRSPRGVGEVALYPRLRWQSPDTSPEPLRRFLDAVSLPSGSDHAPGIAHWIVI